MKDQQVSRAVVAFVLGVDERTITNLVKDHADFPSRVAGTRRTFPLGACVQWYVRFKMDEAAKRANPKGEQLSILDHTKARKELAQAMKAELEIAELRGELLPIAMHEERVAALCERLAARCKTIGRFRGEVQRAMTDLEAAQLLEKIQDELLRALMDVADEIEDPELDLLGGGDAGSNPAPGERAQSTGSSNWQGTTLPPSDDGDGAAADRAEPASV